MKVREVVAWSAVVLLVFNTFRSSPDLEVIEVILPIRKNTKVITNLVPIIDKKRDEIGITHFQTLRIKEPLNDSLVRSYLVLRDSLSRLHNFIEATQQRDYVETLEDSLQVITVETRVNGFIREQIISYETKPQVIEVKTKAKRGGVYVGGFVTTPLHPGFSPSLGAALNLVSPKKVISLGYDTNKNLTLGLTLKLF